MKIVGKTDIGHGRNENQDNYRAGRQPDDTVWAVVCDGMGGAAGGSLASRLAVASMENTLAAELSARLSRQDIKQLLLSAVKKANEAVFGRAKNQPDLRGMGTTLVAVIVKDKVAYFAHAGDSRAYLYHNQNLEQLTKDHSMVQEMVERGAITEEEAVSHPRKNLITRALGVGAVLEAEYSEYPIENQDILLLCSDGLSNFATEKELCDVLNRADFFSAADQMVELALGAGGQDNITALLIKAE